MRDDDRKLAALFREHANSLYRAAFRMLGDPGDAEDAVQDAFVRLRRSDRRPTELENPSAWLFAVLRNICIDRLRQVSRRSEDALEYDDGSAETYDSAPLAQSPISPESQVLTAETLRQVVNAMDGLPAVEAEALTLVVIEGLSYRDVAEITQVPVGTVRSRLNRARRALRMALREVLARDPSGSGGTNADVPSHAEPNVVPLRRSSP